MKKILLTAVLVGLITPVFAGVKEIGTINGLKIVRIRTCSLFCPNTTTVLLYDPNKPGTIEGVINGAGSLGVVGQVATGGGIAGAAALLRPARSNTNVSAGNNSGNAESNSAATGGSGSATSTGSQHVPPGHIDNPSGNH